MTKEVKVKRFPKCDLCAIAGLTTDAHYDARTNAGPWANLCESHFKTNTSRRLGTGHGQRLVVS